MAVPKRKCASCRYFQSAQLAGNGWCTHPRRQTSSDVRLLVRKDELACRNSWGNDMWVSATAPESDTPEQPANDLAEDIIIPPQKLDDEITSVVASDFAQRPSSSSEDDDDSDAEDIVVGEASLIPEQREQTRAAGSLNDDDGINVAAHDDQAHRARVIARGNLDAIVQARDRIQRRRGGTTPSTPSATETPASDNGDTQTTAASSPEPANRAQQLPLVDQRAPSHRAHNNPAPPVPVSETRTNTEDHDSRETDAARFNSVPEIDPDFELPHIDEATRRRFEEEQAQDEPDTILPEDQLSSYELVLQRARAIRAAARAERDQRPASVSGSRKNTRQVVRREPPAASAQSRQATPRTSPARPETTESPAPGTAKGTSPLAIEKQPAATSARTKRDTRFDVSLLVPGGISFRRQQHRTIASVPEVSSPAPPDARPTAPATDVSVLAPSGSRRTPLFWRGKAQDAAGVKSELPASDSEAMPYAPDDAAPIETLADSHDQSEASPLPPYDELEVDAHDPITTESEPSVPENASYPGATPAYGRLRDLYGRRRDTTSVPRAPQEVTVPAASGTPASQQSRSRTDYRIRASQPMASSTLPDIDLVETEDTRQSDHAAWDAREDDRDTWGAHQSDRDTWGAHHSDRDTWDAREDERDTRDADQDDSDPVSTAAVDDRYVLPVTDLQEDNDNRDDWSRSWSFEPQANLHEADAMDEFRARLFGKASPARETRSAAPTADTRNTPVQAPVTARKPAAASFERSPLRASSFAPPQRQRRPDPTQQAPIASVPNEAPSVPGYHARNIENDTDYTDDNPRHEADPDFDIREILAHNGDLLDMTIGLAPDLPRACRTCRDYRPAENGDRGWCANEFAFTHRQMVNADDLACQSTIGCWWLPYDEIWLPDEPVTTPTPRVAKMVTDGIGRKRSG